MWSGSQAHTAFSQKKSETEKEVLLITFKDLHGVASSYIHTSYEIKSLTQQLNSNKEEVDTVTDELKHAYILQPEARRVRNLLASPLSNRAGSSIYGLTQNIRSEGAHHRTSLALLLTEKVTHLCRPWSCAWPGPKRPWLSSQEN